MAEYEVLSVIAEDPFEPERQQELVGLRPPPNGLLKGELEGALKPTEFIQTTDCIELHFPKSNKSDTAARQKTISFLQKRGHIVNVTLATGVLDYDNSDNIFEQMAG